ncbi:MAG: RNA replicase beta chain [Sanya fiers-like virus 31]|nr:MAG: RNA replicase beta chain [Sanya fiers-like virus 31]
MSFLPHYVTESVLRICEDAASPRAVSVAILLRYEEWGQLVSLETDPSLYRTADDYYRDVVVTSLLRKMEGLPTGVDLHQKSVDTFWQCEKQNYYTNERLSPFIHGAVRHPDECAILEFFGKVRKYIDTLIGRPSDLLEGRFGPGATFADKGRLTTIPDKMSTCPTLTSDAVPFLFQWTGTAWATACAESDVRPSFVKGNRFTSVPKDAKKNRGICVEPSINIFYQLGVGKLLKRRLRRAGLDLEHAQDIHRRVAREASIQGYLCTEDLSNASDTICTNLVKLCIPKAWHDLLVMLRSPLTFIQGKWVRLEKFSSMGNGYTFELETLIFLGLIATVMSENGVEPIIGDNIFVFGDDIIFPTHLASEVNSVLSFCGMTVNETKSFVSGYFRESCGGDFFNGVDVRPYFLKEIPNEPQQIIAFANGVRKMGDNHPYLLGHRRPFLRAWFSILDALPSNVRKCRGPSELGDIVIHDDPSNFEPRWRSSIRYYRCYRPASYRKVRWSVFDPGVVLAGAVYGLSWNNGFIIPRDAVSGYKIGWVPRS